MKKLLLIGAMLIVGATSFSAISEDLTETTGGTGGNTKIYSGTAALPIESQGIIADSTGKKILVLTAVDSTGTNGRNMTFDFGAVGRGKQEVLVGKFQAQVLNDKVAQSLDGATIDVKLERENKKETVHQFEVADTKEPAKKLVKLSYELSNANGLSQDKMAYNGEVIVTAFRPKHNAPEITGSNGVITSAGTAYTVGEFLDNSVSLVFNISGI